MYVKSCKAILSVKISSDARRYFVFKSDLRLYGKHNINLSLAVTIVKATIKKINLSKIPSILCLYFTAHGDKTYCISEDLITHVAQENSELERKRFVKCFFLYIFYI